MSSRTQRVRIAAGGQALAPLLRWAGVSDSAETPPPSICERSLHVHR